MNMQIWSELEQLARMVVSLHRLERFWTLAGDPVQRPGQQIA